MSDSTNKINLCVCQPSMEGYGIPLPIESKVSGKEYINYGEDNLFPQMIDNLVDDCSTLGTVVSMVSTYITGAGVDNDKEINKEGMLLSELLEKVVYDYIKQGAFAVQLLRNPYGELVSINYVPVANCRLDENGDYVFIANKWEKYTRNIKRYDRWKNGETKPNTIMYVKDTKCRGTYGSPLWKSALRDALTLVEASKSNYNSIINNFQPNTLISFNQGIPDEQTKDDMEKAILNKYCGSDGSKILLTWSDSQDTAPTVQSFNSEDYTAKYQAVMETSRQNILCSMRVSEQLVGISSQATGFNSLEYENSYKLLYATQIRPMQDFIEKQFRKLNVNFKFQEFKITFANTTL